MTVRVRFAPSPTGHLHIGGIRTALFNYLYAKHHHGQFILRFEDTDLERNMPGAEEEILEGFRWLGFTWDEGPDVGGEHGPYRCTERLEIYQQYADKLRAEGRIYPCFCTPEELEAEREQAQREGRMPRYSGKCRHLSEAERAAKLAEGRVPNWRFAIPAHQEIAFHDLIRGDVQFHTDDMGDFVVVKSNGIPTYNFQVVIDDALMGITHVIRGEEHLSNTPRQLLIFRALGWDEPQFAHLPQVLNTDRKKLSKRDPNVMPVAAYREKGYPPEAIVNFLALLGWSPGGEEEIMSLEEIAERFDLDRVSRSGAVFDADKLRWMAGQYIKRMPLATLVESVSHQLQAHGISIPAGRDEHWLDHVVSLYQEQMSCAEEFVSLARRFFTPDVTWSDEATAVLREPGASAVVARYLDLAKADSEWTADASRARFKTIQQELGVKGRQLYMPVRAAVTGEVHGPDLQLSIACLSKDWVLRRLQAALQRAAE
ncbi:glutamate--tRNA ligase [Alicyclobacillus contaminans]|uniref:glutamate--tRNA ligase n=1 Tax=Alicyclobacillus contaminans TaxID=392016 RepID=UPI000429998E|nr:glutamate--tRNA ligase [Alicyclobacillus contaminans]GMA50485.1 glutamate--tRNA ligase [Alicyclobacillus contaminans]